MKRIPLILLALVFFHCGKNGKVQSGVYEVWDKEWSDQNYSMLRAFNGDGKFEESHTVDRCLLMEMSGTWVQKGAKLELDYTRMRTRETCRDSLSQWASDTASLEIPVREIQDRSFESYLAASGGKAEKWLRWEKVR